MRSFVSVMVLAAAFALLVPDNKGQAVKAAEAFASTPVALAGSGSSPVSALPSVEGTRESPATPDPDAAWLLALGFLGAMMARRLRPD